MERLEGDGRGAHGQVTNGILFDRFNQRSFAQFEDAAPSAMIGASNHFEVAIATATMLFGLSSGAALATVVGVLIEVPVMLMLVKICLKTQHWFNRRD